MNRGVFPVLESIRVYNHYLLEGDGVDGDVQEELEEKGIRLESGEGQPLLQNL